MTTITVTPFADSSFVLAALERPMSLTEILNALPSAPVTNLEALNHTDGKPSVVKVLLEDNARVDLLAGILEALEPICSSVTVSLAVKVETPTLKQPKPKQAFDC
jgi:hypothetical protein